MLSILKPVSEALNKIQKNSCFIADAVEIRKELSEHLKTELHTNKQKLQDLKKQMGQALSPAHFLANNIWYQGQTLMASSAGVERIFSSFELVLSKLRNHLGPDKAGKLVFFPDHEQTRERR
ncbi:hypothetical protein E2320_000280 [Naja naja]|nr:hypothetical protein E2320_000280 [Naja naja]